MKAKRGAKEEMTLDPEDDLRDEDSIVERVYATGKMMLSELGDMNGDRERTLRLIQNAVKKDRLVFNQEKGEEDALILSVGPQI